MFTNVISIGQPVSCIEKLSKTQGSAFTKISVWESASTKIWDEVIAQAPTSHANDFSTSVSFTNRLTIPRNTLELTGQLVGWARWRGRLPQTGPWISGSAVQGASTGKYGAVCGQCASTAPEIQESICGSPLRRQAHTKQPCSNGFLTGSDTVPHVFLFVPQRVRDRYFLGFNSKKDTRIRQLIECSPPTYSYSLIFFQPDGETPT